MINPFKRLKTVEAEKTELLKVVTEQAAEIGKLKERRKAHIKTRDIVVPLDLIRIPKDWTDPNPEKTAACEEYYREHGEIDRTLVINANGYLINGYAGFVTLKKNGVKCHRMLEVRVC